MQRWKGETFTSSGPKGSLLGLSTQMLATQRGKAWLEEA